MAFNQEKMTVLICAKPHKIQAEMKIRLNAFNNKQTKQNNVQL